MPKKGTQSDKEDLVKEIDILGSKWKICYRDDDITFSEARGYTNWPSHEIVVENPKKDNTDVMSLPLKDQYIDMRRVVRHEIVHAFLMESGLDESSNPADAWATNEEMVDWFARQGPKIYKAWKEADAD